MKKNLFIVIAAMYIVSWSLVSRVEPNRAPGSEFADFTGTFELREASGFRVAIDKGWERGGWIPVYLSFGGVEVGLRVKAGDMGDLGRANQLEINMSKLLTGHMYMDFLTYEHNPLRTRMKLIDNTLPVQLKIDRNGKVEFLIAGSPLKLEPIDVTFEEIAAGGQYRSIFTGPNVFTYKTYIFIPSMGIIHEVLHWSAPNDLAAAPGQKKEWRVWALKTGPEDEEELIRRREEIK